MSTSQHLFPSITPEQILEKLNAIASCIQQAVNLEEILSQTTNELRDLLQCDRVLIYRSLEGEAPDEVCASLTMPISVGGNLWGILNVQSCQNNRPWQLIEIQLVQQVAFQLGIAIQQDELRQQVHHSQDQTLLSSEAQICAILAAIPDIINLIDADGVYRESICTNNHRNLIPKSLNPIGKHISELLPADIALRQIEAIQKASTSQEIQMVEQEVWIDRNLRYEEVRVVPIPGELNLVIVRDISDRKQAEIALKESEAMLREAYLKQNALFTGVNDVVLVRDAEGRCLKVLSTNSSNLLWDPEENLGKTIYEDLPQPQADIILLAIRQSLETEQTVSCDYNLDIRGREVWFSASISPITKNTVMLVARDISDRKLTETALKDTEQTLQSILNNAPFAIFMKDLQGRYLIANPAYAALVNHSQADLMGKTDDDIYPPEISAMCGQSDHDVVSSNQSITSEEIVPFGSKQNTFLVTKFTIPDTEGHPTSLCGMAIDISDRKVAEETLHKKLKQERAINLITQSIRNSLDLDMVFEATVMAIGKLLGVDRVSVTQYSPEKQIWQPIAEYRSSSSVPSTLGLEIPDIGNPIAARLKTGEIVCIDDTTLLEDEVNRNLAEYHPGAWLIAPLEIDTFVWGTITFDFYERLRQWQTEEIELISTIADQLGLAIQQAVLYKQLQAEQAALAQLNQDLEIKVSQRTDALRQSEALLQEAQAVSRLGNWEFNIVTGQIKWSRETYRIFGLHPEQPAPTYAQLSQLFDPEDWSVLDRLVNRAIQFAEPYEADLRIIRADGSHGYILDKGQANCNAAGEVTRLFGVVMDISDRKQVEAQLRSSLQEKEVLLKEVHHRVKNNLQMISSLLSLQTNYIEDPEVLNPFIESQKRIKVMALIHEKLYNSDDLAKIDFGDYIRRLVDDLIQSYSRANIRWSVEVDSIELAVDLAIPGGLIVNELISNVVKHAFPNQRSGEISVQFKLHPAELDSDRPDFDRKANSSYYVLSVRDNGVGMPAALDFRNAESLGLQLVCELTRKLKGTIELDRSNGTMFKILFPPLISNQGKAING